MNKKDTIAEHCLEKSHNLQMMKLLAAFAVIFSHAFPITQGNMEKEPLYQLTAHQLSVGGMAVAFFFLTAGFFIAASAEKKKKIGAFIKARSKRIFPLLWIVVLISIMAGAFLSNLSTKEYFLQMAIWKYLINGVLIPIHHLPGVFENNPYGQTVNGALWTLMPEFCCYIICFIAYRMKMLKKKTIWIGFLPALIIMIYLLINAENMAFLMTVYRPCMFFFVGMLFWVYKDRIIKNRIAFWGCIAGLMIGFYVQMANVALLLFFPYVCMYICFFMKQISERCAQYGNLSYGIYLTAFPIQQTFVSLYSGEMTFFMNFFLSAISSGLLSWLLNLMINCKIWRKNKAFTKKEKVI